MKTPRTRTRRQLAAATVAIAAVLAPALPAAATPAPPDYTCPFNTHNICLFTNTSYGGAVLGFTPSVNGIAVGAQGWDLAPGDRIEVDKLAAPFAKSISSTYNWGYRNGGTYRIANLGVSTTCTLEATLYDEDNLFGDALDLPSLGQPSMPKGWNDAAESLEIAWYCTSTSRPGSS